MVKKTSSAVFQPNDSSVASSKGKRKIIRSFVFFLFVFRGMKSHLNKFFLELLRDIAGEWKKNSPMRGRFLFFFFREKSLAKWCSLFIVHVLFLWLLYLGELARCCNFFLDPCSVVARASGSQTERKKGSWWWYLDVMRRFNGSKPRGRKLFEFPFFAHCPRAKLLFR